MSIQHVAAVLWEMPEIRSRGDAFTLAAIADSADRQNGYTYWKSLRDIARAARLSMRGARDALRELERRGYVRTELRGKAGEQMMRWRVLFDMAGKRFAEAELYPPATTAGGGKSPPATTAGPPATTAGPPATTSHPPYNPLIGISVPSSSLSKEGDGQKAGGRRTQERRPDRIRDMSDEDLEQRALAGKLTAQEERERELRRTMRSRERKRA